MNDAIFSLSLNMPSARVCVRPQIKENVTQEPAKGTRKSDEELAALLGRLMYVSEYGPNYRLLKSREAKVHTYIFLFTVLCIRDEQKMWIGKQKWLEGLRYVSTTKQSIHLYLARKDTERRV